MRNSPLKGILNAASPMKQKPEEINPGDFYPPGKVPKPPKKEEVKKTAPPPPKGPTTYIPKKGGGLIALTEPN